MNKVNIIGRLGKDSELRTAGETKALNFSIAVNDGFGDKQKSYFFDVVLFGKSAESLAQYLIKGTQIGVAGKLVQEKWQDQNGNNRYAVKIVADSYDGINLLGVKNNNNNKSVGSQENNVDNWEGLDTPIDDGSMPF